MSDVLAHLGIVNVGDYKPEGLQFGDKAIITGGYFRPVVVQAGVSGNAVKAYPCGIKAPVWYPSVSDSATAAERFPADGQKMQIAYAYYSSVRGVFSQLSPVWKGVVASPKKKKTVTGFWNPRDSAVENDIDTIIVAVAIGTNTGLYWLPEVTQIKADPAADWTSLSIDIDLSEDQLEQGVDMTGLDSALFIPPAATHIGRLGERIWWGGARKRVSFTNMDVTVRRAQLTGITALTSGSPTLTGSGTNFDGELVAGDVVRVENPSENYSNVLQISSVTNDNLATATANYADTSGNYVLYHVFRGGKYARLSLSGSGGAWFDDSMLHMKVYVQGRYIGNVLDVHTPSVLYIDRDVDASILATSDFYLSGYNDRIIPSTYTTNSPGNVPTAIPECVQLADGQLLSEVVDSGQDLIRIHAGQDRLALLFDNGMVTMTGGEGPGVPDPTFLRLHGRVGASSERSVTVDSNGNLWFIGEEGIIQATTSAATIYSNDLNIREFWRGGGIWTDTGAAKDIVCSYSRAYRALILGNISIDDDTDYWGMITFEPQPGFWLFTGCTMTSNIAEYRNNSGDSVLMVGDAFNGRVKQLLKPNTLTDVSNYDATTDHYRCRWWEGWLSRPDGNSWSLGSIRMHRICKSLEASDGTISVRVTKEQDLNRDYSIYLNTIDSRYPNHTVSVSISTNSDLHDYGLPPNGGRYQMVEVVWFSDSGSYQGQPMEICGWMVNEV